MGVKFTKKRCEMQWPQTWGRGLRAAVWFGQFGLSRAAPRVADPWTRGHEHGGGHKARLGVPALHIFERVYRHLNNPDDLACALACKQWSLDSPEQRMRAMATGLVADKDDLDSVMDYRSINGERLGGNVTLMQFAVIHKLDVQAVRGLLAIGVKPDPHSLKFAVLCTLASGPWSPDCSNLEPHIIDWHKWREDQPPCEDHIAIARALIDAGLEVDFVFPDACRVGHRGMVAALIDTGK